MHNCAIHGTSAWSLDGHQDVESFRQMGARLFWGTNVYGMNGILANEVSRHLLSVGPTRSGKGASLIMPNLLMYEGSVFVIDPKGENAYITAENRRRRGKKSFIIDPWGEVNRRYGNQTGELEQTTNYNPFDLLDPTSESYVDDLAYMASALIINQGKDPHWDDSARELLAGLIAYAVEKYGTEATLPKVRSMLQKPLKSLIDIAIKAQKLGENSMARRKLGRFANLGLIENREIQSIVSTAITQTAFLDSVPLGRHLSSTSPGFSFDKLVDDAGHSTIYLVIPVDKLHTHNRWLRLLVSLAMHAVIRKTNKIRPRVLFLLDELGSLGYLPVLPEAYSLAAGMNMTIWGFVQDLTQLKRNYSDWELFVTNSDIVTFFGTMCDFTANYVSKRLGKFTVEKQEPQLGPQLFWGHGPMIPIDLFGQLYARDLLQPDEVSRLPERYGVILRRGANPILFRQLRYYENPNLFGRTRVDPYN